MLLWIHENSDWPLQILYLEPIPPFQSHQRPPRPDIRVHQTPLCPFFPLLNPWAPIIIHISIITPEIPLFWWKLALKYYHIVTSVFIGTLFLLYKHGWMVTFLSTQNYEMMINIKDKPNTAFFTVWDTYKLINLQRCRGKFSYTISIISDQSCYQHLRKFCTTIIFQPCRDSHLVIS